MTQHKIPLSELLPGNGVADGERGDGDGEAAAGAAGAETVNGQTTVLVCLLPIGHLDLLSEGSKTVLTDCLR